MTDPTAVNLQVLADAAHFCFANARANETFSEEQRTQFLFEGKRLRGLLVKLTAARLAAPVTELEAANRDLDGLVARLKDTVETLAKYADTITRIGEVVAALEKVSKMAAAG